jgi:enamine deaminase RidA (YjgF/YER057c/UK114 family)
MLRQSRSVTGWSSPVRAAGTTGQKFPDSITDEIDQAFRNVEQILALADATWDHVITVTSYHVGLDGHQDDINETMGTRFRHFMPNHAPTRTCLGVAALGDHRMRVEIVVTAILPG